MKFAHVALSFALFTTSAAIADDSQLTIELASGRVYTAPVDPRTDDGRLWLRFEGRSVSVLRPIAWSDITRASYQGNAVELSSLPTLARSIQHDRSIVDDLTSHAPSGQTHEETARQLLFVQPVHSLNVSAQIVRGALEEPTDRIELRLQVQDQQGQRTSGDLRIEAVLETAERFQEGKPESTFRPVHRWTTLAAVGNDPSAAETECVALSLPAERESWGEIGRLKLRLLVPGQGEWEQEVLLLLDR